jgi:stearoyl-CoA desaturase (delta-9 desaturase)
VADTPTIPASALITWEGALTALFWAGLIRIALLHHVTWSINSVCHVMGERPFRTRNGDRAANFWHWRSCRSGRAGTTPTTPTPTCARHGVLPGQIDPSARLIWLFERLGWAQHGLALHRPTA